MREPRRQIPSERKALYYGGMALIGLGLLLFFSVFITGAANFGNFNDFRGRAQSEMFRAIIGIALIAAGGVMMGIGAKGLAGSGIVLDPEEARKDVEPWSRMAGGVAQDALSEVDLVKKIEDRIEPGAPEIRIRCTKCQALNAESAKYCNQCGAPL